MKKGGFWVVVEGGFHTGTMIFDMLITAYVLRTVQNRIGVFSNPIPAPIIFRFPQTSTSERIGCILDA